MTDVIIPSNVLEIPLTQGKVALVDPEDYGYLMQWGWYAVKNHHGFYAARMIRYKNNQKRALHLHTVVVGLPLPFKAEIDHKNHNGLHNWKSNLRACTTQQNQQNSRRVTSTSGLKGVTYRKRGGTWEASIHINGQYTYLGRFASKIEAAIAYDKAARQHFGEYACTNFN